MLPVTPHDSPLHLDLLGRVRVAAGLMCCLQVIKSRKLM